MWQRQLVFLVASTIFVGLLLYVMPTEHRENAAGLRYRAPEWTSAPRRAEPSPEWGARLFTRNGCPACHGVGGSGVIDGAKSPGPKLAGVYGTMRPTSTGESIEADASYLRESIVRPSAHVVAGYTTVQMPAFVMKDAQLDAIIAYLETSR